MKMMRFFPACFVFISVVLASLVLPLPARAGGMVGDGSPGSCTEGALDTALAGGGLVTFNCGLFPVVIPFTSQKTIEANTTIDGGNLIIIDGGATTRLFTVNLSSTLNLKHLTLTGGNATPGGAINNLGNLVIDDSILNNNQAPGGLGGCINNTGIVSITNSTVSNCFASAGLGGAIYNDTGGMLTISNSTLTGNFGGLAGGGIINNGTIRISHGTFNSNGGSQGGAISNGGSVTITDSSFNSNTSSNGPGGAILSFGNLVIKNSEFASNISTNQSGGAIFNNSNMTISNSDFSGNSTSVGEKGGGVYTNGNAVIDRSSFINNSAPGGLGGGIYNEGQLTIRADTFSNNVAGAGIGGGIYSISTTLTVIENSTFSGNFGGFAGGGLYASGPASILNSTFAGNTPDGLRNGGVDTVGLKNTIVAGNSGVNCSGIITSLGYNMEDINTCAFTAPGDVVDTDPMLGPLADNGGPTLTQALLSGSPAINAGTNVGCPAGDQRGVMRPLGGTCDIGAYEYGYVVQLPLIRK